MNKRYDVCSPRPRKDSDKPFWHRVGTAWEGDKGISITFDSLPLQDAEGRCTVFLFEPRDKQNTPGDAYLGKDKPQAQLDDEVPF